MVVFHGDLPPLKSHLKNNSKFFVYTSNICNLIRSEAPPRHSSRSGSKPNGRRFAWWWVAARGGGGKGSCVFLVPKKEDVFFSYKLEWGGRGQHKFTIMPFFVLFGSEVSKNGYANLHYHYFSVMTGNELRECKRRNNFMAWRRNTYYKPWQKLRTTFPETFYFWETFFFWSKTCFKEYNEPRFPETCPCLKEVWEAPITPNWNRNKHLLKDQMGGDIKLLVSGRVNINFWKKHDISWCHGY